MKETVKQFIEMVENEQINAWNRRDHYKDQLSQGAYDSTTALHKSPQYQALKAIVDKPFVVTDEMVKEFCEEYADCFEGMQRLNPRSARAALEAVFASVTDKPEDKGFSMDKENECFRCKGEYKQKGVLLGYDKAGKWCCITCGRQIGYRPEEKPEPKKQTLLEFIKNHPSRNNKMLVMTDLELTSEYLEKQGK